MPFRESSRERGNFSLDLHTIRPLADFRARRENDIRVDPGFSEFIQTPRGRISPYLGFIPIIKCFTNVSIVWSREGPFDRS